jgi:hypothetical protein
MKINIYIILFTILSMMSSCKKDEPSSDQTGRLSFYFHHTIPDTNLVGGYSINYDTMMYRNTAGNPYLVNEIQYFISDVTLHKNDGSKLLIDDWKDIHYVDTDLPETWNWQMKDPIPEGTYDGISFTFGISEEKNQSLMFVNPPESNMFWPEYLGGGYHYLKLNGKWKDTNEVVRPYNFHMGIGQIYDQDGSTIIGFVQNYFEVTLENTRFTVTSGKNIAFTIVMQVDKWFEDPHVFDFNYWGGDIMQKQNAMQVAKENGSNVFTAIQMLED